MPSVFSTLALASLPFASAALSSSHGNRTLRANFYDPEEHVYLQGFNWDRIRSSYDREDLYNEISDMAEDMENYIDGVWFPPLSQSADTAGYLPGKWYEIRNAETLKDTVSTLADHGIISIADIVINHRTGAAVDPCSGRWTIFEQPDWGSWSVVRRDDTGEGGYNVPDHCGPAQAGDTGENYFPAPDIDHTNPRIQEDIINWINWLQDDFGFEGLRFDLVKGFAPKYLAKYLEETNPTFCVGEYYDGNVDLVDNWVRGTNDMSHAFDFPLRFTLNDALSRNDFSNLRSGSDPCGLVGRKAYRSATFLENHDTPTYDRPFGDNDQDKILQGYAYILTHPGNPFIFWDHWQNENIREKVKELIALRKEVSFHAAGSIYMDKAEYGLYSVYLGDNANAEKCSGQIAVKLGSHDWSPCGKGWNLRTYGNNYAVWTK